MDVVDLVLCPLQGVLVTAGGSAHHCCLTMENTPLIVPLVLPRVSLANGFRLGGSLIILYAVHTCSTSSALPVHQRERAKW